MKRHEESELEEKRKEAAVEYPEGQNLPGRWVRTGRTEKTIINVKKISVTSEEVGNGELRGRKRTPKIAPKSAEKGGLLENGPGKTKEEQTNKMKGGGKEEGSVATTPQSIVERHWGTRGPVGVKDRKRRKKKRDKHRTLKQ